MASSRSLALSFLSSLTLSAVCAQAQPEPAPPRTCTGAAAVRAGQHVLALEDGGVALFERMNVNVDGAGRAYHRDGFSGGAILHLCNAGQVHLPDGTRYHGSESNATCTGRFPRDVRAIEAAGWDDPLVGAVRWYGILGQGTARIAGRDVQRVRPVEQQDGSGFYVSPTSLEDPAFPVEDQRRYLDALMVPAAVVRSDSGIPLGTLGVAWRKRRCPVSRRCDPTPFIVGDFGPRIGEGSIALTRLAHGLDLSTPITRANRFEGQVDGPDVLYVFFAGEPLAPPYTADRVGAEAARAFERWGGRARLERCASGALPNGN